jgi:hypothetical protein
MLFIYMSYVWTGMVIKKCYERELSKFSMWQYEAWNHVNIILNAMAPLEPNRSRDERL